MSKILKINPIFKELIPKLSEDEFASLRESILSGGIRERIVTWKGVIVDGHNRYKIAQECGVRFDTVEKEFDDDTSVKIWIIKNQFSRRNLNNFTRAALALRLEPMIAEKAKAKQKMVVAQRFVRILTKL